MHVPAETLFTIAQIVDNFHLNEQQTTRLRALLRGRAVRMPRHVKSEPWYRWTVVQEALAALDAPSEHLEGKRRLAA